MLRRLLTINERIDDTEDLVAIKMDHRRWAGPGGLGVKGLQGLGACRAGNDPSRVTWGAAGSGWAASRGRGCGAAPARSLLRRVPSPMHVPADRFLFHLRPAIYPRRNELVATDLMVTTREQGRLLGWQQGLQGRPQGRSGACRRAAGDGNLLHHATTDCPPFVLPYNAVTAGMAAVAMVAGIYGMVGSTGGGSSPCCAARDLPRGGAVRLNLLCSYAVWPPCFLQNLHPYPQSHKCAGGGGGDAVLPAMKPGHVCLLGFKVCGIPWGGAAGSHSQPHARTPPNLLPIPRSPPPASYLVGAIVLMAFFGVAIVVGIVAWIRHRQARLHPHAAPRAAAAACSGA